MRVAGGSKSRKRSQTVGRDSVGELKKTSSLEVNTIYIEED